MKTKNRVLSLFLAVLMFVTALPLTALQVSAADGDTPKVELDYEYDEYSFTMKAQITLSGGGIEQYGFAYSINGVKTLYHWFDEEIGKYEEFSHTISVDPGDEVWYQVIVKNEYGKTAKEDDIFNVPEEEPEIELEVPTINSPDSYDDIVAGEDVEFEWDEVDGAEKYEWELYEADRAEGSYLTSGTTKNEYVTIDGDWFDGNNVYSFYVRAVCDDSYSEWDACYYLYCLLPDEFSVDDDRFGFESEGGQDYVNLTSTVDWNATVDGDWIDINKTSGSGDSEIRIDVEKNTGEFRVGTIDIESILGTITIEIQQEAGTMPVLEVSPSTINVSSEEEYYNFYVTSNIYGWSVDSDEDWIDSLSNSSFNGNSWIQFSVDENKSIESRTGTITVTGGGITKTVTVTQDGRPAIVGDINNDGEITNKDRFLLNRYIAKMAGYTDIDKTLADINGDGSVNTADAEYLSRYLAGWAGYEKLPEINTGTSVCAHTQYTDTYFNTVYVSSTIKTNTTHTYYHVYNRKCSCGVDIGKVQGDLITEAHSYVNNLCACGAYNDASYEKWTGVNVSGAQANVYSTPSATVRYGYINKDEAVTVIGEYGDKYLIEYTLDGGSGVKQGYVNKDALIVKNLVLQYEPNSAITQYRGNVPNYELSHKVCDVRTDGVVLSQKDNITHSFTFVEYSYTYKDNGGAKNSHTIYKDCYEICECGFSRKVSTVVENNEARHKASPNDKYRCCLCSGDITYLEAPKITSYYSIMYNGLDYPITLPSYDTENNCNDDYTFGGWKTVYEKQHKYSEQEWDWGGFVGNLELDDDSILVSGFSVVAQAMTTLVKTTYIKVVLQERGGQRRAILLIGHDQDVYRGQAGTGISIVERCHSAYIKQSEVPPYVDATDAREVADWLVRSTGITLPSDNWSIDNKLLYNIHITYSSEWYLHDFYYKYLSFDQNGNAVTIDRIKSGDNYILEAYEDNTFMQKAVNNIYLLGIFVKPYIYQNCKTEFLVPSQADKGDFLKTYGKTFNIVENTKSTVEENDK